MFRTVVWQCNQINHSWRITIEKIHKYWRDLSGRTTFLIFRMNKKKVWKNWYKKYETFYRSIKKTAKQIWLAILLTPTDNWAFNFQHLFEAKINRQQNLSQKYIFLQKTVNRKIAQIIRNFFLVRIKIIVARKLLQKNWWEYPSE